MQQTLSKDSVFDRDNVITSTQLSTQISAKNINKHVHQSKYSGGNGRSELKDIKTAQFVCVGTQTEGSSVDLQKKAKELGLKEKQLNKKEYEFSQISGQLTVAKSKIILFEKDISDLQKENDLLKSNLLLARSEARDKIENCGTVNSQTKSINFSVEKQVADMELELLKMKVGKLETKINANRVSNAESKYLYSQRLLNVEHTTGKLTNVVQTLLESLQAEKLNTVENMNSSESKSKEPTQTDFNTTHGNQNREKDNMNENPDVSVMIISDSEENSSNKVTFDKPKTIYVPKQVPEARTVVNSKTIKVHQNLSQMKACL